jgi:hypothetical protein
MECARNAGWKDCILYETNINHSAFISHSICELCVLRSNSVTHPWSAIFVHMDVVCLTRLKNPMNLSAFLPAIFSRYASEAIVGQELTCPRSESRDTDHGLVIPCILELHDDHDIIPAVLLVLASFVSAQACEQFAIAVTSTSRLYHLLLHLGSCTP